MRGDASICMSSHTTSRLVRLQGEGEGEREGVVAGVAEVLQQRPKFFKKTFHGFFGGIIIGERVYNYNGFIATLIEYLFWSRTCVVLSCLPAHSLPSSLPPTFSGFVCCRIPDSIWA